MYPSSNDRFSCEIRIKDSFEKFEEEEEEEGKKKVHYPDRVKSFLES